MTSPKLTLEWVHYKDGTRALVFDPPTWAAFERAAAAKSQTASHMISTAVAASFGTIAADNYALNRFMRGDDPDFLRLNRKLDLGGGPRDEKTTDPTKPTV